MSVFEIIKVIGIILKALSQIKDKADRIVFVHKLESAFEKSKSGDTSDIERLIK